MRQRCQQSKFFSESMRGILIVADHRVILRSNYQIWILDMTLDERGRLIFLLSGKPKGQAIREGSQTLMVTSGNGRVLRRLVIEETSFHRLVAGRAALYLLRNRDGLRLDKYNLP